MILIAHSHRMYTNNNNRVAKSAEKLSSGYRVNRAGDDAAGLAISEKMRAQIRGLNMAAKNSNDAISLVQTAEGALQEVQNMLQRMNELAVQSASDTNVTLDRNALQLEFEQLQDEIDQIARTTKFNDTVLLDGSFGGGAGATGITVPAEITLGTTTANKASQGTAVVESLGNVAKGDELTYTVAWTEGGVNKSATVKFTSKADDTIISEDGSEYTGTDAVKMGEAIVAELQKNADVMAAFDVTQATGKLTFTAKVEGEDGAVVTASDLKGMFAGTAKVSGTLDPDAVDQGLDAYQTLDFSGLDVIAAGAVATEEDLDAAIFEVGGKKFMFVEGGIDPTADLANFENNEKYADVTVIELKADTFAPADDGEKVVSILNRVAGTELEYNATDIENLAGTILIAEETIINKGAEITQGAATTAAAGGIVIQVGAEEGHTLDLSIESMNTTGLGITKAQANIATREAASAAITTSREAINKISMQRATLGAMQNRLEYKVNNLSTTVENLQAAESRIRDVDMAQEMSNFTKNNILVQASTAMLAQANSLPQNVLQLLG